MLLPRVTGWISEELREELDSLPLEGFPEKEFVLHPQDYQDMNFYISCFFWRYCSYDPN